MLFGVPAQATQSVTVATHRGNCRHIVSHVSEIANPQNFDLEQTIGFPINNGCWGVASLVFSRTVCLVRAGRGPPLVFSL